MPIPLIIQICLIAGSVIVGVTSTLIFHLKPDNPVEEVAEEIIKVETGETIDLSPDSPETSSSATATDKKE